MKELIDPAVVEAVKTWTGDRMRDVFAQPLEIKSDSPKSVPNQVRTNLVIDRPLLLRGVERFQCREVLALAAGCLENLHGVLRSLVEGDMAKRKPDLVRVRQHHVLHVREECGARFACRIEELHD